MRFYQQFKNIYHLIRAIGTNVWFGFPSKKIKVIGVTGTNGKTTTIQMIGKILEKAGKRIAINSTINYKIGEKQWVNKTKFTTVSSWALQKFIKEAAEANCEYLVLETSSHALDQHRVWGVDYDVAVITNITREHLDYHRTMGEYKDAKKRLFEKTKKVVVVNLDMKWAEEFLNFNVDEKYGYFVEDARNKMQDTNKPQINNKSKITNSKIEEIKAENIKLENNKSEFMIRDSRFTIHLPGKFNIENALAAVCVGLSQDINLGKCSEALKTIKKIPGRMDYVENERGLNIIIDYALTPDSMRKLGKLVNKIKLQNNKLIWIFGACGERDRGKRPIMGKIVSKYADVVIVTNEDPYGEDAENIIDEILGGIIKDTRCKIQDTDKVQIPNYKFKTNSKIQNQKIEKIPEGEISKIKLKDKLQDKTFFKIMDRKEAIKKAIEMAGGGDYILVTGKGAEEIMAVKDERIPWNDRKVIEEILVH